MTVEDCLEGIEMPERGFESQIRAAIESVENVPEPFKIEAFKVILNHLLRSEPSRKSKAQR